MVASLHIHHNIHVKRIRSLCDLYVLFSNYNSLFASNIPKVAWSKCHTHEDQIMDIFDNIDIMEQQCEVLISKIVFVISKNLTLCTKSRHYPYIYYTTPWRSHILHTFAWHLKVLVKLPLSQIWRTCNMSMKLLVLKS